MSASPAFPIFECQIEQRIKSAIFLVFDDTLQHSLAHSAKASREISWLP